VVWVCVCISGICVLKFCTFSSILILHMFVWVCVLCVGVYLVKQVLRSKQQNSSFGL